MKLLALFLSFSAFAADPQIYREQVRDWVVSHGNFLRFTSAPRRNDLPGGMVDELRFTSLADMEANKLMKATLAVPPWSGSYWPTYAGQIANRFGDANYGALMSWDSNKSYLEKMMGSGSDEQLSPAEKYDILVGDANFTLTKKMIQAGDLALGQDGKIPSWFGLCHGWAPASYMMPRPSHSVKVMADSGREISFSPSDLKALASLLWASSPGKTLFIGGRCEEKNPERDYLNREKNPDCLDTNPGTWHLAVVNQIGVAQRSFVLDVTAGYEVWNQPVLGYDYYYINPLTGKRSRKLQEAKVGIHNLREDSLGAVRSRRAESLVKVVMNLKYIAENNPTLETEDSIGQDFFSSIELSYDLELDASDKIVGGEWLSPVHPDFLWTPAKGTIPSSVGDDWLSSAADASLWQAGRPLPAAWKAAALMSSASEQPLAKVVYHLFALASQNPR